MSLLDLLYPPLCYHCNKRLEEKGYFCIDCMGQYTLLDQLGHCTEITTNVTEENANAKLRINFLVRIYDNLGRVVDVYQVFNEEVYTDFFNRVQKGLLRS